VSSWRTILALTSGAFPLEQGPRLPSHSANVFFFEISASADRSMAPDPRCSRNNPDRMRDDKALSFPPSQKVKSQATRDSSTQISEKDLLMMSE